MSFWTAIVLIVGIGVVGELLRQYLKADKSSVEMKAKAQSDELESRLKRIEGRLKNLETIVLDQEKSRKFDQLESD